MLAVAVKVTYLALECHEEAVKEQTIFRLGI